MPKEQKEALQPDEGRLDAEIADDELDLGFAEVKRTPRDFLNVLVSVFAILTVCICVVMLVVVINLRKDVIELKDEISYLSRTSSAYAPIAPEGSSADALSDVENIHGDKVDASEAADIAEGEELENVIWDNDTDSSSEIRRVYLTFDDGPSPNTDRILDILGEYGVKATFFVVGKDGYYSEQYKRIVDEGHTLAMHSYSHVYKDIYRSVDAYARDLSKLHDYLYELTGADCNIVRFPGGSSNTISDIDMREFVSYLEERGMVYFDWNVSSGDAARGYVSAQQIENNVLNNINNYNNAVVLFHDAGNKDTTVEALPHIIETILESENTVLLPISADTVPVQHLH